ncbi:hypothetical protein JTE90_027799 [Oedothorax gibbosus]|uniref:Uncharacterized protein n=1 Tax=Oedothorax gibbosus TaxID=931172 RepID=A0AAV6V6N8_9ARAC|nr:hypothetical protein JTE90_027799 [Oedothorax gibbosus]
MALVTDAKQLSRKLSYIKGQITQINAWFVATDENTLAVEFDAKITAVKALKAKKEEYAMAAITSLDDSSYGEFNLKLLEVQGDLEDLETKLLHKSENYQCVVNNSDQSQNTAPNSPMAAVERNGELVNLSSLNQSGICLLPTASVLGLSSVEEEKFCEERFKSNVKINSDGRFVVKLPVYKEGELSNCKPAAVSRLLAMERKFVKNPEFGISYKLFLKEYGWDDPFPPELSYKWSEFRSQFEKLTEVKIPRWVGVRGQTVALHGFSDASEAAYAAVVYVVQTSEGLNDSVRLLVSKTKVASIKPVSIPRLELNAALLLARLLDAVSKIHLTVHAWTDVQVVLAWLSSPPRVWKQYVDNRTAEILELVPFDRWGHVDPMNTLPTLRLEVPLLTSCLVLICGGLVLTGWPKVRQNGQRKAR